MREFEYIIDEALKKGLSPHDTIPNNVDFLWQALGFRMGSDGIEGYEEADNTPLSGRVDMLYSWPFPQFIRGERYNFLIVRDSVVNHEDLIYLVDDDYTVSHIFTCDVATYGLGTLMEVADFGEYAFMTNGIIMIYWDVGLDDWHEVVADVNIPMMRTVCNFKGQMIGGCVLSAWHDCDTSFYVWSNIGEADFTPGQSNLAGYRRDPYGGEVYHVRRLGDGVIGYSSKGVTLMAPVIEPAPTFGFTELDNVGLINRGAVDGDLNRQVYVGTDLKVREVTKEGVKLLGYKQYVDELDWYSEDVIVKYDRVKKDFYIGTSEKTYLLSPYGLTEVPQHPSAVWTIEEYDEDTNMLPSAIDDHIPMITTAVIDMGYRGKKTIFLVEADGLAVWEPKATVGWMNSLAAWGWSDEVPMNDEGWASIIMSASDFLIKLTYTYVARTVPIRYIKLRYKMTDLRAMRGVYSPPPRGQG